MVALLETLKVFALVFHKQALTHAKETAADHL
jgi:hypothetical protein